MSLLADTAYSATGSLERRWRPRSAYGGIRRDLRVDIMKERMRDAYEVVFVDSSNVKNLCLCAPFLILWWPFGVGNYSGGKDPCCRSQIIQEDTAVNGFCLKFISTLCACSYCGYQQPES